MISALEPATHASLPCGVTRWISLFVETYTAPDGDPSYLSSISPTVKRWIWCPCLNRTPERGAVMTKVNELVAFARSQGYQPDELAAMIKMVS